MFQPWFVELISVLKDVCIGLSALVVAIIAFVGLNQWKKEMTGRTRYEIVRKMAFFAIEFRDKYKRARSYSTLFDSTFDRIKGENETLQEANLHDHYFAYRKRLEILQETLSKLYEASWEAETILDIDIGELVLPLEKGFSQLYISNESYFQRQLYMLRRTNNVDVDDELISSHYDVIYGTPNDNYSKKLDKATKALVDRLKTFL